MNIGPTIKELYKRIGLNQTEFADRIGISQTSASQIVKGHKTPRPKTMKKIVHLVGIPEPFIYLLSMTEEDVHPKKRKLYRILYPHVRTMIFEMFK